MTWATNPFFASRQKTPESPPTPPPPYNPQTPSPASATPSDNTEPKYRFRRPTDHLTAGQFVQIFITRSLMSALICGGITFGIAYAMYAGKDEKGNPSKCYIEASAEASERPVRLWNPPCSLAAGIVITIFMQTMINWLVDAGVLNWFLRMGKVAPIGFIRQPQWRFIRWFMFLDRGEDTHEIGHFKHWARYWLSQLTRGFIWGFTIAVLMWAPYVGVMIAVGKKTEDEKDYSYTATWAPEAGEAVVGACLGAITSPLYKVFWLSRCGWALMNNEKIGQEGGFDQEHDPYVGDGTPSYSP